MADKALDALHKANEETEKRMRSELEKILGTQAKERKELQEARARNAGLSQELERVTQQKTYATDAFESSKREVSKLKAEKQANELDLARLRKMVEELQVEVAAMTVGRQTLAEDFVQMEEGHEMAHRALGNASKQLFAALQAQVNQQNTASPKPNAKARAATASGGKKKPAARPLSPRPRHATPLAGKRPPVQRQLIPA
jgi:DNA repair exonuclease SbcCD ATPase subunit